MIETPDSIHFKSGQREFFGLLAKRMRDVGYLSIGVSIMALLFSLGTFGVNLFNASAGDNLAYLSSYINGNRQIDWGLMFQVLVDTPVEIIVGLILVKGSRSFASLAQNSGSASESLIGGLLRFKQILNVYYVRILLVFGFVWLLVFIA